VSKSVKWRKKPKEKDYASAHAYLSLLFGPRSAARLVKGLRKARLREIPARDILRASHTPMAEVEAFDWSTQHKDIKKGRAFTPILLVCGRHGDELVVADGFHRLCAAFARDQDAVVSFKLA